MRYKEYNSELQLFVPISAFFGNQPRRARQSKKYMYQPVGAPAQNAWSVAMGLLYYDRTQ